MKRGATALAGILPIDKPAGMTSHDVVAAVRRATGEGRVGHAGTLDPMATGLLVVLLGPFTRLAPYLTSATKVYEARISFGSATDTDDVEGDVIETAPVPHALVTPSGARSLLEGFVGPSMQLPPAYSSVKRDGQRAHRVARAGGVPDLEERAIAVGHAELRSIDADAATWDVEFTVSKGTYVRALARDLGRAGGTVAHLAALRRTASGPLRVADALSLADVAAAADAGTLADLFVDPVVSLGLPVLTASAPEVADGRTLPRSIDAEAEVGDLRTVTVDGRIAGVYVVRAADLKPAVALPLSLTGPGAAA